MMIVDHIAAGILFPNAVRKFRNSLVIAVSIFASILPDLPVMFSGWKGSIGYLSHRATTHSFILAPIFSIIPVSMFYLIFRKKLKNSFPELYLVSLAGYSIHIFLDLITPFGTKILYPLIQEPFSLDILHSFDPLFMSISIPVILFFILNLVKKRDFRVRSMIIFLAIYLAYGSVTLVRKHAASLNFKIASRKHTASEYLVTVPRTFWRWKGIAKDNQNYYVIKTESAELLVEEYPILDSIPGIIDQDDYLSRFLAYARFPVIERNEGEIGVHNLIYSRDSYRLVYKIENRKIVERTITGFNISEKSSE